MPKSVRGRNCDSREEAADEARRMLLELTAAQQQTGESK
jgi:hypothetical protein